MHIFRKWPLSMYHPLFAAVLCHLLKNIPSKGSQKKHLVVKKRIGRRIHSDLKMTRNEHKISGGRFSALRVSLCVCWYFLDDYSDALNYL